MVVEHTVNKYIVIRVISCFLFSILLICNHTYLMYYKKFEIQLFLKGLW